MKSLLCAVVGLALVSPSCASTPESEDRAAVRRAVLDYVEAVERGKPELIERSVHPGLHKVGFHRASSGVDYQTIPMTYDQLVELSATMVSEGYVPENPEHAIELREVLDKTASVRLTAFWGIDHIHLANYEGRWEIVQVLWQSPPHAAAGGKR